MGWRGELGGIACINCYSIDGLNIVFVFTENLFNGNPRAAAEVAAHESGHAFGLMHQSVYDAQGVLLQEYNNNGGSTEVAPIMGTSIFASRGIWWSGTSTSYNTIQKDVDVLRNNLFGCGPDDVGNSIGTSTILTRNGNEFIAYGVINCPNPPTPDLFNDVDVFRFTPYADSVVDIYVEPVYRKMLKGTIEVKRHSDRSVVVPPQPFVAEDANAYKIITINVGAVIGHTFYNFEDSLDILIRSNGSYGSFGSYRFKIVNRLSQNPRVYYDFDKLDGNNWCDGANNKRGGEVSFDDLLSFSQNYNNQIYPTCSYSNDYCQYTDGNKDGKRISTTYLKFPSIMRNR